MAKFTPTAAFSERLAISISAAATTIKISSVLDRDGTALPISATNKGYFTLEPGTSREESIVCTGVNAGTNELTGCVRGLSASGDSETGSSGRAFSHNAGTKIIMTDIAQFFGNFVDTKNAETIAGVKTFSASPIVPTPTTATQAANKSYVDGVAIAGAAKATEVVYGIAKLSSAAADPTAPVVVNNEEVSAAGGTGAGENKIVKANASGYIDKDYIELDTDPGLEFDTNALGVKIMAGGGVVKNSYGLSIFNSAEDGNVTIASGTTTLTADKHYDILTLADGAILKPNGFRVFANKIIRQGTGKISAAGNNGSNGANNNVTTSPPDATAAGGAGGAAANSKGTLPASLAGVTGATATEGAGANGSAGTSSVNALNRNNGVAGGAGGASSSANAGGTGGAAGTNSGIEHPSIQGFFDSFDFSMFQVSAIGGSGAAGGGNTNNDSGGGGGGSGSSGGFLWVYAGELALANTNVFLDVSGGDGGNGGNNTGNGGGGGGGAGGNGGVALIIYSVSDQTITDVDDITGGTGGTGGTSVGGVAGSNGTNGAVGLLYDINI